MSRRSAESEHLTTKRVEMERPHNAFKKTYESPVKKSLISQIQSAVVGIRWNC